MKTRKKDHRLHLVSTFMTLDEIEARRTETNCLRSYVRFVFHTKYSGERYGDEEISEILLDAAKQCEALPDGWDPDDSHADWSEGFNPYGFPTALRLRILETAYTLWCPSTENSMSEWIGNRQDAQKLFEEIPELLMVFDHEAEVVGAAWLERTEKEVSDE